MSIEVATYIADLQPVNPPSTDQVSQGDDHLRLVKQVLQNTFTGATRAFQIPTTTATAIASVTVTKAQSGTLYVSTAVGTVTLTLPTLVAVDAGWSIDIVKTSSDVNPIFVTPPAGTINSGGIAGLARARRCIPGVKSTAIWDGTNWFVTRALAVPIGTLIDYQGGALPAGFEWPNGQTLSSAANYPEYNAFTGSLFTLDLRGRLGIPLDNLGGTAAGRLPNGYIVSTTIGSVGGADGIGVTAAQLPLIGVNVSASNASQTITVYPNGNSGYNLPISVGGWTNGLAPGTGAIVAYASGQSITTTNFCSAANSISVSGSGTSNNTQAGANGAVHNNLQPSIMVSKILVVE